jgi:hypothetical protein
MISFWVSLRVQANPSPAVQCQCVPWVILKKFPKCECNTWDLQETKWPVIDLPSQILFIGPTTRFLTQLRCYARFLPVGGRF